MMWTLNFTSEFLGVTTLAPPPTMICKGTLSPWPRHVLDWSFVGVDELRVRVWWTQFMAKALQPKGKIVLTYLYLLTTDKNKRLLPGEFSH